MASVVTTKSRKRKARKKTRIERLAARSERLSQEILSLEEKRQQLARRDNDIRAEYAKSEHRWQSVAVLAAKYGLHRSTIHRIVKRENVEIAQPVILKKSNLEPLPERMAANRQPAAQNHKLASAPAKEIEIPRASVTRLRRQLEFVRDVAAKTSEPSIAQLLNSVIRDLETKKGGSK